MTISLPPHAITPRRRRSAADDLEIRQPETPHVAPDAGNAPPTSFGGGAGSDEVLDAARNRAETGQVQPTLVPDSAVAVGAVPEGIASTGGVVGDPAVTILDGGEGTGGGGTTYGDTGASGAAQGGDATGELEPYQSTEDLFEQYARSILEGEGDTAEQEQLMREENDRLLGMNLLNQRAAMGEAGFGMSGAQASLENAARSDAARQLGLDIFDVRNQEEDQKLRAVESVMGTDLDMQRFASDEAYRQMVLEAFSKIMGGQPDAPPDDGGGGDDALDKWAERVPDGPLKDILEGIGDVNNDGDVNADDLTSVRDPESLDKLLKLIGDVNGDGEVTVEDLYSLRKLW